MQNKQSETTKHQRCKREIERVKEGCDYTVKRLAQFITENNTLGFECLPVYLGSLLYQGRSPSDEFLKACNSIPVQDWPKGANPEKRNLARVLNWNYILFGEVYTETEQALIEKITALKAENKSLKQLAALQRSKLRIQERELKKHKKENSGGLRMASR